MSEPRKTIGSMRFGPFELSTESSELRKHGQRLKLSGQAIDVLLMLASNPGRLVTREELQRKLWPGDSFGDFEHGLNAAVNRLRENLGDSATDPTYIETIPRRGYRFIARVDQVPNTADPAVPDAAELQQAADIRADLKGQKPDTDSSSTHMASAVVSASSAAAASSTQVRPPSRAVLLAEVRRHKGILALMLIALATLIAGLGIYLSRLNERRSEWNLQAMKIRQLTKSGNAANVAVSPDGRYVAYVLREGEKQSLNIRQVATGSDSKYLTAAFRAANKFVALTPSYKEFFDVHGNTAAVYFECYYFNVAIDPATGKPSWAGPCRRTALGWGLRVVHDSGNLPSFKRR